MQDVKLKIMNTAAAISENKDCGLQLVGDGKAVWLKSPNHPLLKGEAVLVAEILPHTFQKIKKFGIPKIYNFLKNKYTT